MKTTPAPTLAEASRALRIDGCELAEGPWDAMAGGLWGVPAVPRMATSPALERALGRKGGAWAVVRESRPRAADEYDPLLARTA